VLDQKRPVFILNPHRGLHELSFVQGEAGEDLPCHTSLLEHLLVLGHPNPVQPARHLPFIPTMDWQWRITQTSRRAKARETGEGKTCEQALDDWAWKLMEYSTNITKIGLKKK